MWSFSDGVGGETYRNHTALPHQTRRLQAKLLFDRRSEKAFNAANITQNATKYAASNSQPGRPESRHENRARARNAAGSGEPRFRAAVILISTEPYQ